MKILINLLLLFILSISCFGNTERVVIGDKNSTDNLNLHNGAATAIMYAHEKVHDGETYRVCTLNISVADGASMNILIKPGTEIHLTGVVSAEGKSYIFFYRNPTYTGGTAATIINMRDIDPNACDNCEVLINPTVSDVGDELECALLNGGSGPQSVGSEIRQGTEWNLDSNNEYLISVINVSGQVKDLNINIQWYEDEND